MIKGFADTHNHQFAQWAFGGRAFWGNSYGDPAAELAWCTPHHGPGGSGDILGNIVRMTILGLPPQSALGHLVGGHPQFDGWPRWDSITHQSVFEDWLHRAVAGGLRLMVMLAVNNEALCGMASKAAGRTCNDMEAVDLQLQDARNMEAHIDNKAGGSGQGWYRIVENPDEARRVMEAGKLAVVLGIEVDYLFNCRTPTSLTAAQLRQELDKYYALGVRHLFPVHFADNGFGGASFDKSLQSTQFDRVGPVPPLFSPYPLTVENAPEYGYRGGLRNTKGLTALGRTLIAEAIARGMIIDVDHMSARTRSDVLGICEAANYPVISGHTGFVEISKGDKSHEGNLLPAEVDRIRRVGGMVSVITRQGDIDQIDTWRGGNTVVDHISGATSNTLVQAYLYASSKMGGGPVGLGTDFNGFAGEPQPRFGREAGRRPKNVAPPADPLKYPFIAVTTGLTMDRSQVGTRVPDFDFNIDGLAHVGMLPDMIADFQAMGLSAQDLDPLMSSAEGYVRLWEKARRRDEEEAIIMFTGGIVPAGAAAHDEELMIMT